MKKIIKQCFLLTIVVALLMINFYADENNYIVIPRFTNLTQEEVQVMLDEHNLKYTVEYDYNHNNKGIVYSIVFYGRSDSENFYVLPDSTVKLRVSLGKYYPQNVNEDSDKTVYLTFDDGPTKYNTYRVLEILEKYNIKATFFFVGNPSQYYREQVKATFDAGHAIGCHSTTHKFKEIYSSAEAFMDDIRTWESIVYDIIGELDYKIYRFPGGSPEARGNSATYKKILESLADYGYSAYDWTMLNNDVWSRSRAGSLTPLQYVKSTFLSQLDRVDKTSLSAANIVLLHETYDCTVDMLEWAIDLLIERGYKFDTLDNFEGDWLM